MAAADTPTPPDETERVGPDRRTALRGMSAMGLAALAAPLAVRPGDGNPITDLLNTLTGGGGSAPAPAPTPAPAPAPSGPKPKDVHPKGYVKAGNTPLASTDDIPVKHGMLFEADEYVVTQPKAGQFIGFDSLCTHEGCPIDVFDKAGEMDCSCHSSKFKLDTGKPFYGPAKKAIPKKPIIIENGQIFKAKKAK
jgi:nitrite reductase/ring-hydroxylating ferredoxin subunit